MFEPSELIESVTETFAPSPIATARITANTPIMTPNVVRIERIKFVRSAVNAIEMLMPHPAIVRWMFTMLCAGWRRVHPR